MPFRPGRAARTAAVLAALLALGACGGGSESDNGGNNAGNEPKASGPAAAATVDLKPTTFEPADVTIKAGETVEWKWAGGVQHNVVGDGFKSELQTKGEFRHTFAEAGSFDYKCDVHPSTMTGTVTVE